MGKKVMQDTLFQVFKDAFKINLFYKPEGGTDNHYYIILNKSVQIALVILGKNFLVIDSIVPLTSSYMPKVYNDLVSCLMNQKEYTVLVQKFGNTSAINDACTKEGVPIVTDERFITIPKKLYVMYTRYYQDNPDEYGFYLLAVNSDLNDIPKEEPKPIKEPAVSVKEIIPKNPRKNRNPNDLLDENLPITDRILSVFDTRTSIETTDNENVVKLIYLGIISATLTLQDGSIHMTEFNQIPDKSASAVDYLQLLETLEKVIDVVPIYLDNVSVKFVYEVARLRGYSKIEGSSRYSMGSYKMAKYKK